MRYEAENTIEQLRADVSQLQARAIEAERRCAELAAGLAWHPIETYPKLTGAGTKVLVYGPKEGVRLLRILPEDWTYRFADEQDTYYEARLFTHWMYAPERPPRDFAADVTAILATYRAQVERETLERVMMCSTARHIVIDVEAYEREFAPKQPAGEWKPEEPFQDLEVRLAEEGETDVNT